MTVRTRFVFPSGAVATDEWTLPPQEAEARLQDLLDDARDERGRFRWQVSVDIRP